MPSEFSSDKDNATRTPTSFGERVRLCRDLAGIGQQALASKVGVSLTTIQNYEGGQYPKGEIAVSLAGALGCTLDWLLAGRGQVFDPTRTTIEELTCESPCDAPLSRVRATAPLTPVIEATSPQFIECMDCQLTMVPMVEARLSAGTGSFETGESVERRYAFRSDWINTKGQPSSMVLMRVAGDSMEPHIFNNDTVLIDQSQTKPRAGSLFAVGVEDVVYIKMVDTLPGKIVLKSYNEAYAPLEIDTRGDLADGIRIIGRAVWIGRELY
ncbi:Phage repressor protein C, contains Cro/C1-type HTH and peptisase s24 domains [Humidesulfovibrio mexicanus]|uniref:Phage repressor protein C, contains Cro/C1-type HTH and peptisase s24 domains n=1 Tax=Humidesulfovibrio mexicanus TaxID=147047 RepID=A0A239AKI5_9BACT|nr:XRE family transcriptional regulator [Humidesulfovibrio mexicanus]SNR95852.1 Phage repressor protein C, contains Cro/C1-type HTH and peptisase s24 domains [Humidesulfovibrio mexicanus]